MVVLLSGPDIWLVRDADRGMEGRGGGALKEHQPIKYSEKSENESDQDFLRTMDN